MQSATVDEQGRIEIPADLRQRMGINNGAKVRFELVGNHLEMHVEQAGQVRPVSGFGMLKSERSAVPVDLDPASLIQP